MSTGSTGEEHLDGTTVTLFDVVTNFAEFFIRLNDQDLDRPWSWKSYQEGFRYAILRTYEEIRELAVKLATRRAATRKPITTAQRILGNYHSSFRDLQAILLGVDPADAARSPGEGEWSIHHILGHIMAAERQFYPRTRFAVDQQKEGIDLVVEMPLESVDQVAGDYDEFERTIHRLSLPGVLAYYNSWHKRVIQGLMDIRGLELDALSKWWEDEPMPVEFRLHRFDSHLRQHIIQVEKTLDMLDIPPTEGKRLLRWVYHALSQVENATIGEWSIGENEIQHQIIILTDRLDGLQRNFLID